MRVSAGQKPLALVERLVLVATLPGDLLLDPFGGAGTLAVAAQHHSRHFRQRRIRLWRRLLIESVPRYVEMARHRLAAETP